MRFSIIMPVLNEAAVLEGQLRQLSDLCRGHECEIMIVDGGSDDQTVAIAERYGQVVHAARGRAVQMNAGAEVATGEVLIFLHADTQLPALAFKAIERVMKYPNVVGGAFRLSFDARDWRYRLVAWSTNMRSRLRNSFTGDQAYFIRAASFHAVDGYPEQPLMEDLEIITRVKKIGKIVLLPQYVVTSARRHQKIGLWKSIVFMWYLRTLYACGVSSARLQRMYLDIR